MACRRRSGMDVVIGLMLHGVMQLHGGGVEMVTPPRPRPARSPSTREFKTPEQGPDNQASGLEDWPPG